MHGEQENVPLSPTADTEYTTRAPPSKEPPVYSARVFWDAIEWFRQERKVTKKTLAAALGIHPTTLDPDMRADKSTSLENVFMALKVLKVTPGEYATIVEMLAEERRG